MELNTTVKTKSSFFAKYAFLNLIGQGLIVAAGILFIPMLVHGLGTERFGVLTLAWAVTGYFSIFDFGIGRAMTKLISEKLGLRKLKDIPEIVWTGLLLMLIVGVLGTLIVSSFSQYLVQHVLSIPVNLQNESKKTLFLLAFSIPIVIIAASLRGILEAYQRFDLMNYVRIPLGMLMFISPLVVLQFSKNLIYIISSLILIRLIECIVNLLLCFYIIPSLPYKIEINKTQIKPLISFGSWITISNIIGPILVYMDRFFISSMISLTAVSFYSAPYELNNRLLIIPSAIVGVLFSAFSATYVKDISLIKKMFASGLKYTYLIIFPIILFIVLFSSEGLELWLGKEFANKSAIILKLLACGALVNSLSYIPSALIQAAGRPDLTAKLNIIELPFYLITLFLLVKNFGTVGAALAYVLRALFDTITLFIMSHRILSIKQSIKKLFFFIILTSPLILFSAFLNTSFFYKFLLVFFILTFFLFLSWKKFLETDERNFICEYIKNKFYKL